jgi:hypothetical protein
MQTNLASTPTELTLGELAPAGHPSNRPGGNPMRQKWKVAPGALGALMRLGISPSVLFGAGELPRHAHPSCAPERRPTPDEVRLVRPALPPNSARPPPRIERLSIDRPVGARRFAPRVTSSQAVRRLLERGEASDVLDSTLVGSLVDW